MGLFAEMSPLSYGLFFNLGDSAMLSDISNCMNKLIIILLLFSSSQLDLSGQSAKDKILNQIKKKDKTSIQEKVKEIRKHFVNLQSFTDPYIIVNRTIESGDKDECGMAILIEEKSKGNNARKRNIIYSFNASEIDFPDTWRIDGDILSLPFINKESVTAEVYRGTKFIKVVKLDFIDVVCPEDSKLLLEPLAEIVEACQNK